MDLWLWLEEEKLIVKNFDTKYEINNGNIVKRLRGRFPKLSKNPVLVKEEVMLYETEDQKLNQVCKKIYETAQKDIIVRRGNKTLQRVDLDDQIVINLCVYKQKKDMLEAVVSNNKSKIRVVFPIEDGCIAMYGSPSDIKLVINKYITDETELTDSTLVFLGISKAKQLLTINNVISFIIVKNEFVFMNEKYLFKNIALCKINRLYDLEQLEQMDSNEINTELNLLSQLFDKMSEYIISYGFEAYYQIPYKISSFKYRVDGNEYTAFATGDEPGEVYVRSLKLGLADLLDGNTTEKYVKWSVAQTRLDVMIEAVLPLLFDKLIEQNSSMLKTEEINFDNYQHVVLQLLHQSSKIRSSKICVRCISIENSILKAGVLTILDDENQQIRCYGTEKEQIISSLLIQYYALCIQNQKYLNEFKRKQIIRIGNSLDLHGEEEAGLFGHMKKEVQTILIQMRNYKFEISEWQYNYFLNKSNMKCLKVKLKEI